MDGYMDGDDGVARLSGAGKTLSAQPDLLAFVHAGRDRYLDLLAGGASRASCAALTLSSGQKR